MSKETFQDVFVNKICPCIHYYEYRTDSNHVRIFTTSILHGTYCVSTPPSNSPVEDFSDVYSQNAAYRSWGLASGTEENIYSY